MPELNDLVTARTWDRREGFVALSASAFVEECGKGTYF